nr:MAG: VP1 [Parvoviridae sp.]
MPPRPKKTSVAVGGKGNAANRSQSAGPSRSGGHESRSRRPERPRPAKESRTREEQNNAQQSDAWEKYLADREKKQDDLAEARYQEELRIHAEQERHQLADTVFSPDTSDVTEPESSGPSHISDSNPSLPDPTRITDASSGSVDITGSSTGGASVDTGSSRTRSSNTSGMPGGQSGSSEPGGQGADVGGSLIIRDSESAPRGKLRFKHTFQIQTPSVQFTSINTSAAFVPKNCVLGTNFLSTPLCTIDPNQLALYMTQAEYGQLPGHSWAEKCRIKCTPLGYRAPFATNEPTSVFANSQTVVQCCYAIGLNKIFNGVLAPYTFTSPTKPANFNGDAKLPAGTQIYESPATCGEAIWWNSFYSVMYDPSDGWPTLSKFINVTNINDCKGVPAVNYEYNFKNGRLKYRNKTAQSKYWNGIIPEGNNNIMYSYRGLNQSSPAARAAKWDSVSGQTLGTSDDMATLFGYDSVIEKAAFVTNNAGNSMTPDSPPLVHVGVMPLSTDMTQGTYNYAPLIAIWEIECELTVGYSMDYVSSVGEIDMIQASDPICDLFFLKNQENETKSNSPNVYISGRRISIITGTKNPVSSLEMMKSIGTVNTYVDVKYPTIGILPNIAEEEEPIVKKKSRNM